MFTAAAIVPSPPVLVPELNGASAAETDQMRSAALDAAARLGESATNWVIVGVGDTEVELDSTRRGTFRGFGVDVEINLSPDATGPADPSLPLPALIGGWLRGQTSPLVSADVRVLATDTSPVYCAELGGQLRRQMDASEETWGVLVVADGSAKLTPKAPGAFDPRAEGFQDDLDWALAGGDCGALAQLDPVVCLELAAQGRAAFQVLAAVFDSAGTEVDSAALYKGAPFGVGYDVAFWVPAVPIEYPDGW